MPLAPKNYRLAIVTPLANEEATLSEFFGRVTRQLNPQDSFICVVDNVSTDRTREILESYSTQDPRVRCVWAPENRCVVDAYFCGYREALATDADWILEMDGGLSHCPEEIEGFRSAIEENRYDYIGGCRFVAGGEHEGSISRRLLSQAGTVLSNFVLGTTLKDMTSGFQCFTRDSLQYVLDQGVKSRAHFFQTEIKFLLRQHRCVEIPITYQSPSSSVNHKVMIESVKNLASMAIENRKNAA